MSNSKKVHASDKSSKGLPILRTFRQELMASGRTPTDPDTGARCDIWSNRDFQNEDLTDINFTASVIKNCNFTNALVSGSRFEQAVLGDCSEDLATQTNLCLARDWYEHCVRWYPPEFVESDGHIEDGEIFQDAPFAPLLARLPMGSMPNPVECTEKGIFLPHPIAVAIFPLTVMQLWFYWKTNPEKARGRSDGWSEASLKEAQHVIVSVSWDEIGEILAWLSHATGQDYRMITEAEWEYALRLGALRNLRDGERQLEWTEERVLRATSATGERIRQLADAPLQDQFAVRVVRSLKL